VSDPDFDPSLPSVVLVCGIGIGKGRRHQQAIGIVGVRDGKEVVGGWGRGRKGSTMLTLSFCFSHGVLKIPDDQIIGASRVAAAHGKRSAEVVLSSRSPAFKVNPKKQT
jgi:hypothetical protein